MSMSLRKFQLTAALVAALSSTAVPAGAETFRLRIGSGHPASAAWVASVRDFFVPRIRDRVKAETQHQIEWTEGYGGSVCKIGECLEAVESGLLDAALVAIPFEPSKLLAFNFTYFAPFGSPDPAIVAKATGEVIDKTPALRKLLEDKYNQVFVGHGPIGNYGLVTTFKWATVADLAGHKIAAAGPNIPWLEGTGIVPVQSNLNEGYTSLQTGVYEGWIMYPDGVAAFKFQEVAKQYVITDFGSITAVLLTVNKDTWSRLPPEVQKIIQEVGRGYAEYQAQATKRLEEAALATMRAAGMEVRELDQAQKAAWAAKLQNLPKLRTAEMVKQGLPADIVYNYIAALKAAGHQFPRDWAAER